MGCGRGPCEPCAKDSDCGEGLACGLTTVSGCQDRLDCEPVSVCKPQGNYVCDCQKLKACQKEGRCVARDGECIATSDADCQKKSDRVCVTFGQCTARDGKCIATSDADCQKSKWCEMYNKCTLRDGECVLTAADCRRSARCKESGTCTLLNEGCVATSDEDCQKSTNSCRRFGLCTAGDGECVGTSDEDCRKSKNCETAGQCIARNGKCVKMRFTTDLAHDVVLDTKTGLTWQRHATTESYDWQGAADHCSGFGHMGYKWRLPSRGELKGLVTVAPDPDGTQSLPDFDNWTLNGGRHWTSSRGENQAWVVGLTTGRNMQTHSNVKDYLSRSYRVRCVTDGTPPASTQDQ